MRLTLLALGIGTIVGTAGCDSGKTPGSDGSYQATVVAVQLEKKGSTAAVPLDDLPLEGVVLQKD